MKNFTLLLAAAALSVSSAFAVTPKVNANLTTNKTHNEITKFEGQTTRMSRADAELDVEWQSWLMTYIGVNTQGSLSQTSKKMDVAIDGDQVYIAGWDTWLPNMYVTGTIDGDVITFANKQFIGTDTNPKWGDDAYLLATEPVIENQQISSWVSVGETFTLNYNADAMTISSPDEYLTLFVNTGDGDTPNNYYDLVMNPQLKYTEPQEVVVLPDGVEVEDWILSAINGKDASDVSMIAKVAFDGNTVYFGGFDEQSVPGTWVKGTINDNKITLANPQFLGYIADYQLDFYMLGAMLEVENNELVIGDIPATLTFDYDATAGTITAPELLAYCVNAAPDRVYYLDMFIGPMWTKVNANAEPAAPVNPEFYGFKAYEYSEQLGYGYGGMIWIISQISTNDGIIPTDKLFYTVYADNEVYALEPDDYEVDKAVEMIPYTFAPEDKYGDLGIYVDNPNFGPNTRAVWFYREISDNIGCQAIYKDGDTLYKSQICWVTLEDGEPVSLEYVDEVPGAGIAGVAMDQEVRSIEYYNVAGQKVNNPNGLTIVKITLNDGTVKAIKTNK